MIVNVSFAEVAATLPIRLTEDSKTINISFGEDYNGKQYNGAYEVTPSRQEKILNTQGCYMSNDVTVKKIPFAAVTNQQGGKTITIA